MGMEELKRWMQLYGSIIFVILFNKDWKEICFETPAKHYIFKKGMKMWNCEINILTTYEVKWSSIEYV